MLSMKLTRDCSLNIDVIWALNIDTIKVGYLLMMLSKWVLYYILRIIVRKAVYRF